MAQRNNFPAILPDEIPIDAVDLDGLLVYPKWRRRFAGGSRITAGLFTGSSNLVTFGTITAVMLFPLSALLAFGVIIYAIKSTRDVYKHSVLEAKLIDELKAHLKAYTDKFKIKVNQNINEVDGDLADYIKQMLILIKQVRVEENNSIFKKINKFRLRLKELEAVLEKIPFDFAGKDTWKTFIKNSIVEVEKVDIKKLQPAANSILPNIVNQTISKKDRVPLDNNGWYDIAKMDKKHGLRRANLPQVQPKPAPTGFFQKLWVGVKKAGNRGLSFIGGASAGATIALTVITLLVELALITNPVGWTLIGIVASAALVAGIVTMVADYFITKGQNEKIDRLKQSVNQVQTYTGNIDTVVDDIKNTKESLKENIKKREDEIVKEQSFESQQKKFQHEINDLQKRLKVEEKKPKEEIDMDVKVSNNTSAQFANKPAQKQDTATNDNFLRNSV